MLKASLSTIAGLAIGLAVATPAAAQFARVDGLNAGAQERCNKDDNRRIDQRTRDRHYEVTRDQNKRR